MKILTIKGNQIKDMWIWRYFVPDFNCNSFKESWISYIWYIKYVSMGLESRITPQMYKIWGTFENVCREEHMLWVLLEFTSITFGPRQGSGLWGNWLFCMVGDSVVHLMLLQPSYLAAALRGSDRKHQWGPREAQLCGPHWRRAWDWIR